MLNAFNRIERPARLIATADELLACDMVVLPGVGSADETMRSLRELGLLAALREHVLEKEKPFVGICVGMQVLFEHSEEGDTPCLGYLKGKVRRFDARGVRVPQMGWNRVRFTGAHPALGGADEGYFYFVNSYYADPEEPGDVFGVTDYGGEFCSAVRRGNIVATQFHLEKSGEPGLRILARLSDMAEGGAPC